MRQKRDKLTKKISILVVLGLLICATLVIPTLASDSAGVKGDTCYTHGDINADGSVTSKDAIQLLYYATIEDEYSVEQDCDFDGDEAVDVKDAIHLLYSVNDLFSGMFGYGLEGVIHAYGEPIWTWNITDGKASVTAKYRCACGAKEETVVGEVELTGSVAPTCTEVGSATYSARAVYDKVEYFTTKNAEVEALGHQLGDATCADRECQNTGCNYVEKSSGHNFGDAHITAATCTTAEVRKYICADCEYEYEEHIGVAAGHTLDAKTLQEVLVDKDTCEYKQMYTCTSCKDEVEGARVNKHSYVATIEKEATCQEDGTKTYKCKDCGDTNKEAEIITVNPEAHVWDEGEVLANRTTYHCTICAKTKTTVKASNGNVSLSLLKQYGEVEVNDATIKLDQATANQLNGKVQISADVVTEDIGLTDEEKAQIGNNPIYDFGITSNGMQISSFAGTVTVSLPYTLQDGDDADCIDVWFINDDGKVEIVQGVYSNGFVTFTTDHFSYYTVTRLTPKQRCEKYGHSETTRKVEPTCEEDGYTLHVCVRCAESWKTDVKDRLTHQYEQVTVEATCKQDGSKTETCKHCKDKRTAIVPKKGHTWKTTEETVATCEKQGEKKLACSNDDCDECTTEIVPKKAHDFESKTIKPTCDARGYDSSKCKHCGHEDKTNEKNALGHDYEATWNWVEDGGKISATLTLTCKQDKTHVVAKDAAIDIAKQVAPSCSKGGSTTYKAVVSYNQVPYEDEFVVGEESFEHQAEEEWKYNATKHYRLCTVCGEKADEAAHVFDEGTVTVEATCSEEGSITYTCACGYKKTEKVPALAHDFKNDVCTVCGYNVNDCDHEEFHIVKQEFSEADGICGNGYFYYETCDCGEVRYIYDWDFSDCCIEWEYFGEELDANGYQQSIEIGVCEQCHMVFEEVYGWEITENCEGTETRKMTITTQGNQILVEYEGYGWAGEEYTEEHPAVVPGEVIDMTKYGLCGGTVTKTHCPCGEEYGFNDGTWDTCDWLYNGTNSDEGADVYICAVCGIQRISDWETTKEGCRENYTSTLSFYRGGEKLVEFVGTNTYDNHDIEYTFVLDGTECSDGYTVKTTCKDCGEVETWHEKPEEDGHWTYSSKMMELSDEETCGGYLSVSECPCGQYSNVNHFNMNCVMSWQNNRTETEEGYILTETRTCQNCGLKGMTDTTYVETEQKCTLEGNQVTTYWLDDTKLVECKGKTTTHTEDYTTYNYELSGESCEDGVKISRECTECGDAYTQTSYGHSTFKKETYNLAEYGMCGGTVSIYGCACGEDERIEESRKDGNDDSCEWYHWKWDEATDTYYYKCVDCGITKLTSSKEEAISGCLVQRTSTYEYLKGYNVVLSVESSQKTYSHDYKYEFIFNNENAVCSDGFTVKEICKDCGSTNSWFTKPSPGEHYSWYELETYDMESYGFCGGEVIVRGCPCGAVSSWNSNEDCEWTWYKYEDESKTTWHVCLECGGFKSEQSEILEEQDCYYISRWTITFYDAEMNEKFSFVTDNRMENHNYEVTFKLNGTTCSDGYTVTQTCRDCGFTYTNYEQPNEGQHNTYSVQRYNLKDYGLCGTEVYVNACPCGEVSDCSTYSGEGCNWMWFKRDNETGAEWYQCSECGGSYYYVYGEQTKEGCYITRDCNFVFFDKDNKEVLNVEGTNRWSEHDYEVLSYTLLGDSCEEGVVENVRCKDCGYESRQSYSWHKSMTVKEYLMSEYGACGDAVLYYQECYCGEQKSFGWERLHEDCSISYTTNHYIDEEGIRHDVEVYACATCGLRIEENKVSERDASTCKENITSSVVIAVGDALVDSFTYTHTIDSHDYEETATLLPASTDCEDGVKVVETCKECQYSTWYTTHGHHEVEVSGSRIDLSTLGSVCGGYVVQTTCACGEYSSLELVDTNCDFDSVYETPWLGDDLSSQSTAESYFYPYNYETGYIKTCAVTDPEQCGFAIRGCEYVIWDKDNCRATKYTTWQLGYDKATGEYKAELTVADFDRTYHDYEDATTFEETSQGTVETRLKRCRVCDSTYSSIYTCNQDYQTVKNEEVWVNTLNDGENKCKSITYEYDWYKGYQYQTLYHYNIIDENGVSSWSKQEYIYDWDNFDCTRIYRESNNNGVINESEQTCHKWSYFQDANLEKTCTQYGIQYRKCDVCDCRDEEYKYVSSPYGHNWRYISSEGFYKCYRCDLESINGASGQIIMEDMTETYGNDTSYVVGYWNKGNVDFTYYVSVVPTSSNEEEIVLTDIDFTEMAREEDGIQAISFNKTEVETAAKKAVEAEKYTGEYVLRFTFVPVGSDGNFDYAITFTDSSEE